MEEVLVSSFYFCQLYSKILQKGEEIRNDFFASTIYKSLFYFFALCNFAVFIAVIFRIADSHPLTFRNRAGFLSIILLAVYCYNLIGCQHTVRICIYRVALCRHVAANAIAKATTDD